MGLILTVPVEESVRGDILHLSHTSFRFCCHFASINASSTIELCSREHTIALFGTTNATIICNDSPSVLTTRKKEQNAPRFDCWMTAGVKNIRIFNQIMGEVCTSSTSKAAFPVAISISNEAYMEFMARELPTMSTSGKMFPEAGNLKYDVCRLSTAVSNFGFNSMFFLLVTLFLDLYLLISLSSTAAHKSRPEI